jgi:lipoate-protein ligase A
MTPRDVRRALKQVWEADEALQEIPLERIEALKRERYSRDEWNFKY